MDYARQKLADAEERIAQLERELEAEGRKRASERASAEMNARTLTQKIEHLERRGNEAAALVREATAIAARAGDGDVFRQRVPGLEFGVAHVELGPVPEGAHIVLRIPRGTSSDIIAPVLRELATTVAAGQVSLDVRRGTWTHIRGPRTRRRDEERAT